MITVLLFGMNLLGVFIVLASIPTLSFPWIAIAFVLFRFFDILKPYPIRYFDQKLESGSGIMVDDVLAAIYVIVIVILRIVRLAMLNLMIIHLVVLLSPGPDFSMSGQFLP